MKEDKEKVLRKQKLREKVLFALWLSSEGKVNTSVNFFQIADDLEQIRN